MSAVHEAIGQRERASRRLFRWSPGEGMPADRPPGRVQPWPLLAIPPSLVAYMLAVLACDLALIGWELAVTPPRTSG